METFLIDVPVPSMGATVNELTVIDLLVAPGARIAKGQKIAEMESDKSVFEFEAPCDGIVVEVQGPGGRHPALRRAVPAHRDRRWESEASGGQGDRKVGNRMPEQVVAASQASRKFTHAPIGYPVSGLRNPKSSGRRAPRSWPRRPGSIRPP